MEQPKFGEQSQAEQYAAKVESGASLDAIMAELPPAVAEAAKRAMIEAIRQNLDTTQESGESVPEALEPNTQNFVTYEVPKEPFAKSPDELSRIAAVQASLGMVPEVSEDSVEGQSMKLADYSQQAESFAKAFEAGNIEEGGSEFEETKNDLIAKGRDFFDNFGEFREKYGNIVPKAALDKVWGNLQKIVFDGLEDKQRYVIGGRQFDGGTTEGVVASIRNMGMQLYEIGTILKFETERRARK